MATNVPLSDTNSAVVPSDRFVKVAPRIWNSVRSRIGISGFDFAFAVLLLFSAIACHYNVTYWAGQAYVGNWQYGDAQFWWDGAIQSGEGILRDNPNVTYRMGYAVTAGLWVALFGANFHVFHTALLVLYVVAW